MILQAYYIYILKFITKIVMDFKINESISLVFISKLIINITGKLWILFFLTKVIPINLKFLKFYIVSFNKAEK